MVGREGGGELGWCFSSVGGRKRKEREVKEKEVRSDLLWVFLFVRPAETRKMDE